MSEEWRSPPSSLAATVSGSDDPKSTGQRSGDPAISTEVSLEGWRRYARYWPWPCGRHGRGRGRQGMSAMDVAQSISRILGPRWRWQRPRGRDDTQESREEELGPVAGKADNEIAGKESKLGEGSLGKPMAGKTDAEIVLANRWLPRRYPAYPSTGKFEDFLQYTNEIKRIRELNKAGDDRAKNLPTWGVESDHHDTKDSVEFQERDVRVEAGESVVAVSSVRPGHGDNFFAVV